LHHTLDCRKAFFNISKSVKQGRTLVVGLYWKTWLSPFWRAICGFYQAMPSSFKTLWRKLIFCIIKVYDIIRGNPKSQKIGGSTLAEEINDWFGVPHRTYHTPDELMCWFEKAGFSSSLVVEKSGRFKSSSNFIVMGEKL